MRQSTERLIEDAPALRKPDEVLDALQSVSLKHPQRLKVIGAGISGSAGSSRGHEGQINRDIFFHPDFPATQYLGEYRSFEKKFGTNPLSDFIRSVSHPFTLSEAMRALKLTGEARWSFDLFREFGVRDALLITCGQWLVVYSAAQPLRLERGERYQLSMAASVAVERMEQFVKRRTTHPTPELSDRQLVVLRMFAQGLTADEIAEQLRIRAGTVRSYVRRILEKMSAHSIAHAVNIAWLTGNFDRCL